MKKILVTLAFVFMLSSCSDFGEDRLILGGDKPSYPIEKSPKKNNESNKSNKKVNNSNNQKNSRHKNESKEDKDDGVRQEDSKPKDNLSTGNSKEKAGSNKDNKDKPSKDKKDPNENLDPSDKDKDDRDSKNNKDKKDNKSEKPASDDNTRGRNEAKNPEDSNSGISIGEDGKSKNDKHGNSKNNNTTQEKKLVARSIYLGKSHVKYLDVGINNYNIKKTQKLIDDGNIISTVTKFNPKDNEITYFSGHTYNFGNVARLKKGSIVTVTDSKGRGYKYRIVDFKKYRAGDVESNAPFIGGYHLMNLAGDGIGVESIVIQYCDENDIPIIFLGMPI